MWDTITAAVNGDAPALGRLLARDPNLYRASGMNPDLPNWQLATRLYDLCGRDGRGRPRPHRVECSTIRLDAGASISAKDEDCRSAPLAWATRRGHGHIAETLRRAGATA